ncbi:hypothetical protein PR048_021992 [Dryococelus australis]|uniref:Uncharacterized protein n=1 Tax=Dryococelus australis TaxID=614101 RepID=A0ABQ9GZW6_9NEOP|nr:hypothetical protein PR048_021992 [Dryococelus australis]
MELEAQNDQLKKEMEKIHMLLLKHAGQWDQHFLEALEKDDPDRDEINKRKSPEEDSGVGSTVTQDNSSSLRATTQLAVNSVSADLYGLREVSLLDADLSVHSRDPSIEEYVLQGAVPKHAVELYDGMKDNSVDRDGGEDAAIVNSDILMLYDEVTQSLSKSCLLQDTPASMSGLLTLEKKFYLQPDVDLPSPDQEQLLQKLSMLQLRLDEASKTLQAEREYVVHCDT